VSAIHNPFRFNGEYTDFETGFQYLRMRFYDPNLGRFINEDPFWNVHNMQNCILSIRQSANLFVYALNNPIMHTDPTGLAVPGTQITQTPTQPHHQTQLRPWVEDRGGTIDHVEGSGYVTVRLNGRSQRYYINPTASNPAVHGNHMRGGHMYVNTQLFAQHFRLVNTVTHPDSDSFGFTWWNSGPIGFEQAGVGISWRVSASYIVTHDEVLVTSFEFYINIGSWASSRPAPNISYSSRVSFVNFGGITVASAPLVRQQVIGAANNPGGRLYAITQPVVFRKQQINASVNITVWQPQGSGAVGTVSHRRDINLHLGFPW